ncbi:hypothetical protein J7E94_33455, partial [Streptomyces sp. ISL-94]|nr:hypothetical protein [Streptomyces sp. ISL-94]
MHTFSVAQQLGNGASEVTVCLSSFDQGHDHDPGEQAVHQAFETSLWRLEQQVRLRRDKAAHLLMLLS